MEKTYPWSAKKHAHDIEFIKDDAYCTMMDEGAPASLRNMAEECYEQCLEILSYCQGQPVVYLPGRLIQVAKGLTVNAEEFRAIRNSMTFEEINASK